MKRTRYTTLCVEHAGEWDRHNLREHMRRAVEPLGFVIDPEPHAIRVLGLGIDESPPYQTDCSRRREPWMFAAHDHVVVWIVGRQEDVPLERAPEGMLG